MAYRPNWFRTDQSILDMALDLHMLNNGSYEPCDNEEKQILRSHLEYALANWQEPTKDFDYRVKQLITEVLIETWKKEGIKNVE